MLHKWRRMRKMKKLRKLSALMLAFVMVLSFAACGKSESNAVGTWSIKLDLSTAMKEELGSDFANFNAVFGFTVYLDLDKDGGFIMYIDEQETKKDMEAFMGSLADYFVEYLYTAMESQGTDRATAQTLLESQFGMPVKDYAVKMLNDSVDISEMTASMTQKGVYEIKNGKIFMGVDKVDKRVFDLITIDGDKMTIDEAPDAESSAFMDETIPGLSFPLVLTRVK